MKVRFLFFSVLFFSASINVQAQHVVRKGVKPVEVNNKASAAGEKNYTLAQLQGKWQEYMRSNMDGSNAGSFTDTLMLKIDKENGEVKEGMSLSMQGETSVDAPDMLNVAGDSYRIVAATDSMLTLNDGENIKALKKVQFFYLETVGKDSIHQPVYVVPGVNVTMAAIKGKWSVYRREAKPGAIAASTELIKSLSITTQKDDSTAAGEITLYTNDVTQKLSCTITIVEKKIIIAAKGRQWTFVTYKGDGEEFVFGVENEVTNYAKKL